MIFRQHIAKHLLMHLSDKKTDDASVEDHYVARTYGSDEDHFVVQQTPDPKDLALYGTPETVIDVASDHKMRSLQDQEQKLRTILFTEPQKPSGRRFAESYNEDLRKYGTPETAIDVANDELAKKKSSRLRQYASCAGKKPAQTLHEDLLSQGRKRTPGTQSQNPFAEAFREFPRMQVSISNTSNEDQEVILWGAARFGPAGNFSVSAPRLQVVAELSHPNAVHPQNILYNPVNQLLYVANQISGTVSVINNENEIVTVVALNPAFAGASSAIALAVNTDTTNPNYGSVYVAGSISNTVSVITTAFSIAAEIAVGTRPVSLVFNPMNSILYVANFNNDTVMLINTHTNSVTASVAVGANPVGMGVNPWSGEIYVSNASSNSISVIDSEGSIANTIPYTGTYPTSIVFHPLNNSMYAVVRDSERLLQIDAATQQVLSSIYAGPSPYNCFFNPEDGLLYVQSSSTGEITLVDAANTIVSTIPINVPSIGAVIHPLNNLLYISNTAGGTVQAYQNYSPAQTTGSSSLTINPDYAISNADFQFSPAIIKHARFIMIGPDRISAFKLEHFTPTGNTRRRAISFENFVSPQLRLNVAEAVSLADTVIDGQTAWRFMLPAHHSVSILIWYVQIRLTKLFNNSQSICT